MKFIYKIKSSKAFKKTIAVIASASLAVSAMAVNVFAAEGGGTTGVDYASLSTTITNAFKDIVNQCIDVAVAVLPIGLGILGLGKLWDVAKKFFTKSTSG